MYKIDEFMTMVNNHEFVEAHEVLEHDWKKLKKEGQKDKAKFLQGLINGTTAIALFLKGKKDGCIRVWATFEKYKYLLDEIDIHDKSKYEDAIKLLEKKYDEVVV